MPISKPKSYIHILRHGETLLNQQDRLRGWLDVSLDKEGFKKAHALSEKLLKEPIDIIITSDLIRAQDTASIISLKTGKPISLVTKNLRPWDLGKLAGRKINDVLPEMIDYAENKPDESIDGGESFNTFKERFLTEFCDLLEKYDGLDIAIVCHTRNERVIAGWIKNGQPNDFSIDISELGKDGIAPGEYITYTIDK